MGSWGPTRRRTPSVVGALGGRGATRPDRTTRSVACHRPRRAPSPAARVARPPEFRSPWFPRRAAGASPRPWRVQSIPPLPISRARSGRRTGVVGMVSVFSRCEGPLMAGFRRRGRREDSPTSSSRRTATCNGNGNGNGVQPSPCAGNGGGSRGWTLIGELLVKHEFVTPDDLQRALLGAGGPERQRQAARLAADRARRARGAAPHAGARGPGRDRAGRPAARASRPGGTGDASRSRWPAVCSRCRCDSSRTASRSSSATPAARSAGRAGEGDPAERPPPACAAVRGPAHHRPVLQGAGRRRAPHQEFELTTTVACR